MKYRFPNMDSAEPDWSIVPGGTIPPDETSQAPLGVGTDGVEKILLMNNAAFAEYKQNVYGFLSKIPGNGVIADIPLSVVEET